MQMRVLAVAVCAAMVAACGGTSSKPHTNDAGGTTSAGSGTTTGNGICTDDNQCGTGTFCINGHCGVCNGTHPLQCPAGTFCGSSGACTVVTGSTTGSGSTGGTTGSTGSGGPCTHRSDCSGAQACLELPDAGGECGAPAGDAGCASNDQCVKAYICQAHECVYGCQNNNDCHGTQQPVCYSGNPGHCGACTANSQCLSNENCDSSGHCVARANCTDASSCNGLGCVNGTCSPCTASTDCVSPNVCDPSTGKCVSGSAGCTSDTQCQSQHSNSPAWYCASIPDGGAPVCKLGCVADNLCGTPQTGCCNVSAGQTCNTTSHTCQAGGSTGTTATTVTTNGTSTTGTTGTSGSCTSSFDCNTCFNNNQQCDQTHCQCVGQGTTSSTTAGTTAGFGTGGFGTGGFGTGGFGTGGFGTGGFGSIGGIGGTGGGCSSQSGGVGEPCGASCGCNTGLVCTDGSTTYSPTNFGDIAQCELFASSCLMTCETP
ncbi:MAG: hypothetical protein JST54_18060 [Deltaproteobacteria bacterium]|nr:hypothetical protein [Deltaproteobacteria bacterium]